jgi:hypothetical protein
MYLELVGGDGLHTGLDGLEKSRGAGLSPPSLHVPALLPLEVEHQHDLPAPTGHRGHQRGQEGQTARLGLTSVR